MLSGEIQTSSPGPIVSVLKESFKGKACSSSSSRQGKRNKKNPKQEASLHTKRKKKTITRKFVHVLGKRKKQSQNPGCRLPDMQRMHSSKLPCSQNNGADRNAGTEKDLSSVYCHRIPLEWLLAWWWAERLTAERACSKGLVWLWLWVVFREAGKGKFLGARTVLELWWLSLPRIPEKGFWGSFCYNEFKR